MHGSAYRLGRRLGAWRARVAGRPVVACGLGLALVLLVGLWLRLPQIGAGLPYLYDPDEVTHYRRLVRMVQTGDLHPHYFLKPSLHFYLRIPAVAGGFLWSARAGEIRSVQEIVTGDDSARDGLSRTASHPRILRWARAVSTLLSLLMIAVTYRLGARVVESNRAALLAALLVACSPALIGDSEKVGVDTLMALMCVVTVWLAWRIVEQPGVGRAALAGLAAGLAVSSKYNALPIVAVPVLACLLSGRGSRAALITAVGMPGVGFLAGTPYALVDLPRFLDGMAFEIVHYGIRGHGFATVEPGWPHAQAFLGRMAGARGGVLLTALGLAGAVVLPLRRWRTGILLLTFPACFALLMLNQRVAFFRNMLVMIPFFAILAAWTVERSTAWMDRLPGRVRAPLAALLVLGLVTPPLARAVEERTEAVRMRESRHAVSAWLRETARPLSDTAIAAELQLPPADYAADGVTRARTDQLSDPVMLFLDGYSRIVVGPAFRSPDIDLFQTHRIFAGDRQTREIQHNPEVTVYHLPRALALAPEVRSRVEQETAYTVAIPGAVRSRVARVSLTDQVVVAAGPVAVTLEIRSPWPGQSCRIELPGWRSGDICAGLEPDKWERRTVTVPALPSFADEDAVWIVVEHVHVGGEQRIGIEIASLVLRGAE